MGRCRRRSRRSPSTTTAIPARPISSSSRQRQQRDHRCSGGGRLHLAGRYRSPARPDRGRRGLCHPAGTADGRGRARPGDRPHAGVKTILNPAPAAQIAPDILALCDFVTPNESEAEGITGVPVASVEDATRAAALSRAGRQGGNHHPRGERGALSRQQTGAARSGLQRRAGVGDHRSGRRLHGAFATALAAGADPVEAVRFGCAAAGISVTRAGTAPSMPAREEILALLAHGERN